MRALRGVDYLPLSLLALFSLADLSSAVNLDCKDVIVKGYHYNFSPLKGPHAVHWIREEDPSVKNFTFTVDLCAPLKQKDAKKEEKCPSGTHVCGVDRVYNNGQSLVEKVVPIAGNFIMQSPRLLEPKWTRLKDSPSNADSEKDGLLLELNGGKYPFNEKKGKPQKAIIEFLCDKNTDGLDGDEDGGFEDDDDAGKGEKNTERADDGEKKDEDKTPGHSLTFLSYKTEGDDEKQVLRLQWKTKYACEGESENVPQGEHWGFFTWLIIILFLAIAAYLIFGSWLNYNRYGARGWDLLPHGDTIRDIPYYLKEFARNVAGAFQSPARRGGYSAV